MDETNQPAKTHPAGSCRRCGAALPLEIRSPQSFYEVRQPALPSPFLLMKIYRSVHLFFMSTSRQKLTIMRSPPNHIPSCPLVLICFSRSGDLPALFKVQKRCPGMYLLPNFAVGMSGKPVAGTSGCPSVAVLTMPELTLIPRS